jgi:hypothetical protein
LIPAYPPIATLWKSFKIKRLRLSYIFNINHIEVFVENESHYVLENNHLWRIMQMNIDERLAKYLQRDFSQEQAQILVLMEEAAIALFAAWRWGSN